MGESEMEISLAKPPSENRQKEKRKRMEQVRMMMGGRYVQFIPFSRRVYLSFIKLGLPSLRSL